MKNLILNVIADLIFTTASFLHGIAMKDNFSIIIAILWAACGMLEIRGIRRRNKQVETAMDQLKELDRELTRVRRDLD